MRPVLEIYSSIECPYAYLAVYRLRQLWPEFAGRVQIVWRALSLEYINRRIITSPPMFAAERELFAQIEPALPWNAWTQPQWDWPVTLWPAFEALACAQAQNDFAAWEMSWALRHAFFAQGRNISLRHEILALAVDVGGLDLAQFETDWDSGRYKQSVIAESQRGWYELKLNGSATFVIMPDGRQITNPAIGEIDFDEENYALRSYTPYEDDPLTVYSEMLESIVNSRARDLDADEPDRADNHLTMELPPYQDNWADDDPHANFKAEVAQYSQIDPLPTLETLSRSTGIPVPALVRYILVKYAVSGAEALLLLTPIVLRQMEQHLEKAEASGTDAARLEAYEALRQMIGWLKLGAE